MKLEKTTTLSALGKLLNCEFVGDAHHEITGLNEIHRVEKGDLVFVDHPKYYKKALNSLATTILINEKVDCPSGKGLLISQQPFDDFNRLTKHFRPEVLQKSAISEKSAIHASAYVGTNVFIGHHVEIGANCIIHAGAYIGNYTTIGQNVVIGPGTIIGYDAFYYKKKNIGYDRLRSCGGVTIKDNVEIGALTTIDRGVTAETTIGYGTKIDNKVHIGHDTVVGEHCLFAANVGIAGCVTIHNHVTLWGQVGLASDIVVEDNVTVLAQSGSNKNLEAGKTYFGSPAGEVRVKFRELAAIKKMPEILENL